MKTISLLLIGTLLFAPTISALPVTTPAPIPAPPITQASRVGIVAAVKGSVKIDSQSQVGRIAGSGETVYLGDQINTDDKGSLQILLLDETSFTIGPNSSIIIDKFIYDPKSHDGEVKAKVVKGVFRFVTGKIGQKKPSQMEVELPIGTIGIRGTIVAGQTDGNNSMVALLGPGVNNNTQHNQGSFVLQNLINGQLKEALVSKTGFGTTIDESGIPSNPFQISDADLANLMKMFIPAPDNSQDGEEEGGNGQSATEQSGQDNAVTGQNTQIFNMFAGMLQRLLFESSRASQDNASQNVSVQEGITKASDLSKVTTGQYHYSASNIPFRVDTNSTYSFTLDIDFGARTVGGGNSKVYGSSAQIDGGDAFQFALGTKSFPTSGFASFNYSLPQGSDSAGTVKNDASGSFIVNFTNSGDQVATGSQHTFVVNDVPAASSDFGSGSAPRSGGLS